MGEVRKKGLESIITGSGLLLTNNGWCLPNTIPHTVTSRLLTTPSTCVIVFYVFCVFFLILISLLNLLVMAKQVVEIWKDTRGYLRLRFGDYLDETDTDPAAVISHISAYIGTCAPVSYRLLWILTSHSSSPQNHNWAWHTAQQRGCDLREKAIRAKVGRWPYKKKLFPALLITWNT